MASNPYVNKVEVNGSTIIDLTSDTVDASHLYLGYTAHDLSGALITGTLTGGGTGDYIITPTYNLDGTQNLAITDGSPIIVSPQTFTVNGTYTPTAGTAYGPVTVNVASSSKPGMPTIADSYAIYTPAQSSTETYRLLPDYSSSSTTVGLCYASNGSGLEVILPNGVGNAITTVATTSSAGFGVSSVTYYKTGSSSMYICYNISSATVTYTRYSGGSAYINGGIFAVVRTTDNIVLYQTTLNLSSGVKQTVNLTSIDTSMGVALIYYYSGAAGSGYAYGSVSITNN